MTTTSKKWYDMEIPTTEDQACELAESLRDWYIELYLDGDDDMTDQCTIIAKILAKDFDGEIWAGSYEGIGTQYHEVARVGNFLIDISGDQFGGYEIACPHVDELADWTEYYTFKKIG